ncbi:hypothetical protein U9M48_004571 [Paspalum notatum var. saurae]|uniref:Uncharacterized protein n=1 Tax=Paspalum notatum var. saurae TaxID=547442 RepID=A0AAQ3SEY3_PASNO
MFLGHPTSFAVDPSQFGMIGGCAYFILHRSRLCPDVIKYRFDNESVELVERLREEFRGEACSWLTPQPVIAPSKEIRQRVLDRIKLVKEKQQEQGRRRRRYCF